MEYFATLAAATAIIVILAFVLYRGQRDIGVLLGTAALYYWSLFGAWYVVIDKTGGFSGKSYHYLETKMFPVALDDNYLLTIVLYAAFIITVQVTLLVTLKGELRRALPPLLIRHQPILLISFAAGLASYYIIHDKISEAWALNTSAYWYTRSQTDEWFTLHQVLNRLALLPAAVGFAVLLAGDRSRYFISFRTRYTVAGYLVLLGGMAVFTFILGNKNEVLVALLTGMLAYLATVYRPKLLRAGLVVLVGVWFLYAIDFFRAVPVSGLQEAVEQRGGEANELGRFLTSSNEAYAAHFSMYGVLAANVEPKFGYSVYALVCSVVPRLFWPERPRDIYLYYSESVGAIQNQGYSLHHATGWYLNFGALGVVLGGAVLGMVWSGLINARFRIRKNSGFLFRVFAIVAPWFFVAYLPPLVRAGPEGYKGLIVEGFLIPLGSLALACNPKRSPRRAHLQLQTLTPAAGEMIVCPPTSPS